MATFLLIHGAWHGSWCWEKIIPNLQSEGHIILSPDLPGRGCCKIPHSKIQLSTYVDFLKDLVKEVSEPMIIVGHSFGGIIASQLAEEIPEKISHLVYVCGFLPQNGQSLMEIAKSINHVDQPAAMTVNSDGSTISVDRSILAHLFYNCCTLEDQQLAIDRICPEPLIPMTKKVSLQKCKIPKTYIECTLDNALTPKAQKIMYTQQACNIVSLSTDHSPFFSTPQELVRALLDCANRKKGELFKSCFSEKIEKLR